MPFQFWDVHTAQATCTHPQAWCARMSARSCSLITRAGTGYLLSSHESLLAATVCVVGAQGTLITERCLPTSATTGPMHELRGTL